MCLGGQGDRPLLIGGIAAISGGQDQVLTGVRRDHELLARGASDRTAVGLNGHSPEAATLKDAPVGLIHLAIGLLQAVLIGVEGIGVLHDEFAPTHQAEAGTDLIAKLGLNLVEVHRKLLVGPQQISSQGRDHFLVGRTQTQLPPLAVLEVEHDPLAVGVARPTAAALPELRRLELGQKRLQGSGRIELLTNNRRDLLKNAPEEGQIGVNPTADPADVPGPEQQFVGGDLSLGGVVPQRHQHQAGDAHRIERGKEAGSYHLLVRGSAQRSRPSTALRRTRLKKRHKRSWNQEEISVAERKAC